MATAVITVPAIHGPAVTMWPRHRVWVAGFKQTRGRAARALGDEIPRAGAIPVLKVRENLLDDEGGYSMAAMIFTAAPQ